MNQMLFIIIIIMTVILAVSMIMYKGAKVASPKITQASTAQYRFHPNRPLVN